MPAVLLVDDRPENLVALEAVLEPLGKELVAVGSGSDALRVLLHRDDFAVILLDAQMPQMDGFETAEMIKGRERTRNIPIIFLTAISKERENIFRGYEVGAVDYVFKPLDPEILRGKVSVFLELYEKNEELRRQRELLALQETAELRRESAERYRQLADAMPQIVWTADPDGRTTYYNRRWFEYTGMLAEPGAMVGWADFVHPDDLERTVARRRETLRTGEVFEIEYRFRRADGTYHWHLGRAVPIRSDRGEIEFWIGTATDIDDRKRGEEAQRAAFESERIARTRTERLQGFTARLAPALTVESVVEIAIDKILIVSEGAMALLGLVSEDGGRLELTARGAQLPDDLETVVPRHHASAFGEVVRSREPLWVTTRREWERYPDSIGGFATLGAVAVLPLATAGRFFGLLAVVFDHEREFPKEEREFLLAIARQAAQALDRARLYDEQSHIAHVLQDSLLPHTLPTIPGVALATSYRAAGRFSEAGGDFYDAFEANDGHFVVIGDVCGKGPAAASLTALCRYTLRACALQSSHARPAELLRLLNRAILEHGLADSEHEGDFATVTCVLLRTVDGELTATIASGGHPPTLVRRQTGLVEAYEPTGPLVGVLDGAEFDEQTVVLEPGDVVVLHTDGLNDARSESGDRLGEDPVRRELASLGEAEDADAAIASLEGLLGGLEVTDDIAIVAFRVGEPVPTTLGALDQNGASASGSRRSGDELEVRQAEA